MEWYSGNVVRHIKNRRHPYININNYVTASAHLAQVQLLYNLERLPFDQKEESQDQTVYDACKYCVPRAD